MPQRTRKRRRSKRSALVISAPGSWTLAGMHVLVRFMLKQRICTNKKRWPFVFVCVCGQPEQGPFQAQEMARQTWSSEWHLQSWVAWPFQVVTASDSSGKPLQAQFPSVWANPCLVISFHQRLTKRDAHKARGSTRGQLGRRETCRFWPGGESLSFLPRSVQSEWLHRLPPKVRRQWLHQARGIDAKRRAWKGAWMHRCIGKISDNFVRFYLHKWSDVVVTINNVHQEDMMGVSSMK